MKETIIQFRCTKDFKKLIKQLAKAENRTVSNYIIMLVEKAKEPAAVEKRTK